MAHLRTNLLALEDKMEEYNNSLQEQLFVIEGLKRRAHADRDGDDQMVRKYQNKYEKLYFSRNNHLENWKNYKSHLQDILKRDKYDPPSKNPRSTFTPTYNNSYEGSPLRRTSIPRRS